VRQGRTLSGRATIACTCFAILALSPAAALAAYDAGPTDGPGSIAATGTTSVGHQYSATFTSSFSPAHIQPGEPFTYTARTEALEPQGFPSGCTPGTTSQTTPYDSWFFFRVGPGEDFYTEGSAGTSTVAATYTNTEILEYICPAVRFTTGPMTVSVSGEQSQTLEPGCYQSTIWENSIYFPDGGPSDLQRVDSLSGTVGTLRVGDGPDCEKPGSATETTQKLITFAGDGSGELELTCDQLANPCEGKAELDLKKKHGGRVLYPRCTKCKLASGPYSIPAGDTGQAHLKLTKAGIRLLFRGGHCHNCAKQRAEKGQVLYPSCKKCKVELVTTDTRTHATSHSQIRMRGGHCHNCAKQRTHSQRRYRERIRLNSPRAWLPR
jgi:hypothetical protein